MAMPIQAAGSTIHAAIAITVSVGPEYASGGHRLAALCSAMKVRP